MADHSHWKQMLTGAKSLQVLRVVSDGTNANLVDLVSQLRPNLKLIIVSANDVIESKYNTEDDGDKPRLVDDFQDLYPPLEYCVSSEWYELSVLKLTRYKWSTLWWTSDEAQELGQDGCWSWCWLFGRRPGCLRRKSAVRHNMLLQIYNRVFVSNINKHLIWIGLTYDVAWRSDYTTCIVQFETHSIVHVELSLSTSFVVHRIYIFLACVGRIWLCVRPSSTFRLWIHKHTLLQHALPDGVVQLVI